MNKYPYVQLKELCSVNQGLQVPISKRFKEGGENRYFYITVQFLKDTHTDKHYIENPPPATICEPDDIIVVRTGSTGQVLTGISGCFHNNFFKVNYDKSKVLGKYLYYCLTSKEKQKEMKNRAGITTIPDLNHFMFLDMKIPLPSYPTQKAIVEVLDNINEKLHTNNEINNELRSALRLIHDYWFEQFDFPDLDGKPYRSSGGSMVYNPVLKKEIPENWCVKDLSELASIKAGGDKPSLVSDKKTDGCEVPIYSNGIKDYGIYGYTNKSKINKPSITVSARGTIGVSFLRMEPFVPIIRLIVVTPKDDEYLYYLNQILQSTSFENSGSVQKQLTAPQVSQKKIVLPDQSILSEFNNTVSDIIERLELIRKENDRLKELKDWLLPMLLSGQLTA
ncbi:restriction endonuclease subunit S [Vibrio harveyi]